jgi:hypothetical protein
MESAKTQAALPPEVQRRIHRYRVAALVILLAGLAGAGARYWLGPQQPDYSEDPSMLGFNRAEERQMGVLYGKQGQLIEAVNDSLKQPGTQALLIGVAAAVVALGCFQFSRVLEFEAQEAAEPSRDESG